MSRFRACAPLSMLFIVLWQLQLQQQQHQVAVPARGRGVAMQASRTATELSEWPTWSRRSKNAVSAAFATSWCYLSEYLLLKWPVVSIGATIGVCMVLASGLVGIDVVYSFKSTLHTSGTNNRRDAFDVEQLFPSSPRFSQLLFTPLHTGDETDGDPTNVLTEAIFDDIWGVAEKVASIEAGLKNELHEALCYRHAEHGKCAPYGVLSFWDGDEALYRNVVADSQSLRIGLSAVTFNDGTPVPRDLVFGNFTIVRDEASNEEILEHAYGVVVTYALSDNADNKAAILEWESAFLRLAKDIKLNSSRMLWQAAISSDIEQQAGVQGWTCTVVLLSLMMMALASSLMLGDLPTAKRPSVRTRVSLGSAGVVFLVLSTAAAGGALAMGGVPLPGLHLTFIAIFCVAIGLMNMFGLCAELDDDLCEVPATRRVYIAASRWVPGSALVATLAFLAVIAGAGPYSCTATRTFCAYAGASVLLGWVTQVFGLVPCLLLDERRRDAGRCELAFCSKERAQVEGSIDERPRVPLRRDSFVIESLSALNYPPHAGRGADLMEEVWNDSGDERAQYRPSPHPSCTNGLVERQRLPCASPPSSPSASNVTLTPKLRWSEEQAQQKTGHDLPSAKSSKRTPDGCHHQRRRGQRQSNEGLESADTHADYIESNPWWCHRLIPQGPSKSSQPLSSDPSPSHLEIRSGTQPSLGGYREIAMKNGIKTSSTTRRLKLLKVAGGYVGQAGEGESGIEECCSLQPIIQGYCNWLLDGFGARWGVLAFFGVGLATASAIGVKHATLGYNANDFYPPSSYLYEFVTIARQQGLLFGESSVPVAAYVQGVDLSSSATQQAILGLEIALVASSPSTISSTSSVSRGDIMFGNATSSWLQGFIRWLPSSSYASTSGSAEGGVQEGASVGAIELFDAAIIDFLAVPSNQRFEDELSFRDGRPDACRLWARHLNFKGFNSVETMQSAKGALSTSAVESNTLLFAREYIYAEHLASITWQIPFCMMATAVSTIVVGFLCLGKPALVCILMLTTITVQVLALTMATLLSGGNSGINAYAITPSLFLATALGAGSVGAMLKSFASQDSARSFHVNLRIAVAETSGPVISASVVVFVGVLPLLIFSVSSPSATQYVQSTTISTMWAVLLSLSHGLLLAPTLLLVFGEKLTMDASSSPRLCAAETGPDTLSWLSRGPPGRSMELFGSGYTLAVGRTGAVAVLGNQNFGDARCKETTITGDPRWKCERESSPSTIPAAMLAHQ